MNSVFVKHALLATLLIATFASSAAEPINNAAKSSASTATSQPLSNAARDALDHARDSVVQLRGFFGDSDSDAFHGTAFVVAESRELDKTKGALLVTNYHVVSEALLFPQKYRLEYRTTDNRSGTVRIVAIDLEHDLAIVQAKDFFAPALHIRSEIPSRGERAYSIGFPLDLGLTITEGVANGLVEDRFDEQIHYSGALNPGMSGGPALDANSEVYGVNVAYDTRGQLASFVIPAKYIAALLIQVEHPLARNDGRAAVGAQLLNHQAALLAKMPVKFATQAFGKYALPAKIIDGVNCGANGDTDNRRPFRIEVLHCGASSSVYVQAGLETGSLQFEHSFISSEQLNPLQFADRLNRVEKSSQPIIESSEQVAPFSCEHKIVALSGFDARVATCVRAYRMFAGLYDISVFVVSLNQNRSAIVSTLNLRGVAFDTGMPFVEHYLAAMRWAR